MKQIKLMIALLLFPLSVSAQQYDVQALQGYDAVAYFTQSEAVKGNGNYSAQYDGKTYLFSSKANKELFLADPAKYQPQYGGWCAFGVSKGKKYASDATAWSVVDGKLYLNLNKKVRSIWMKNKEELIDDANSEWLDIKNKAASDL